MHYPIEEDCQKGGAGRSEIKDLYAAGTVVGDALPLLGQALLALTVTLEAMEDDGIHPAGEMNEALALNFAARFPMYHGTLHLILRDMWTTFDSLQTGVDSIFEASEKQAQRAAKAR